MAEHRTKTLSRSDIGLDGRDPERVQEGELQAGTKQSICHEKGCVAFAESETTTGRPRLAGSRLNLSPNVGAGSGVTVEDA